MKNLKLLRKSRKLTLVEFAEIFNVKQATVWQWENARREPDIKTLIKIADHFNVSIDFIVNRVDKDVNDADVLLRNSTFAANKEKYIPLIEKIIEVDDLSFLRLEGYIDSLIEMSKKEE